MTGERSEPINLDRVITWLAGLPWWVIIITVLGVSVGYSVLTSAAYLDIISFLADDPVASTEDFYNVVERLQPRVLSGLAVAYGPDEFVFRIRPPTFVNLSRDEIEEITTTGERDGETQVLVEMVGDEIAGELVWEEPDFLTLRLDDGNEAYVLTDRILGQEREPDGCTDLDEHCTVRLQIRGGEVTGVLIAEDDYGVTVRTHDPEYLRLSHAQVVDNFSGVAGELLNEFERVDGILIYEDDETMIVQVAEADIAEVPTDQIQIMRTGTIPCPSDMIPGCSDETFVSALLEDGTEVAGALVDESDDLLTVMVAEPRMVLLQKGDLLEDSRHPEGCGADDEGCQVSLQLGHRVLTNVASHDGDSITVLVTEPVFVSIPADEIISQEREELPDGEVRVTVQRSGQTITGVLLVDGRRNLTIDVDGEEVRVPKESVVSETREPEGCTSRDEETCHITVTVASELTGILSGESDEGIMLRTVDPVYRIIPLSQIAGDFEDLEPELLSQENNAVGTLVHEASDVFIIRVTDPEYETFRRERIMSEQRGVIPCPRDQDPDCEDQVWVTVRRRGEVIVGELTQESERALKIRVPGQMQSVEVALNDIVYEDRSPDGCTTETPGGCRVLVALANDTVQGVLTEETEEWVTLRTVDPEYIVLRRASIEEERRREPGQCALNNLGACDRGIFLTLRTTLMGFALALLMGLIGGLFRVSSNPVLYALSTLYVEIVRGIPLLVILLYAGFVFSVWLRDNVGIELSDFQEATIGLAFGYGAYLSEVFRAGIQSISKGQMEAARSLGMSYTQAMRHVILPQAIRVILPPLGNDFISMLKDSALISVLALPDLLQMGRLYISRTFRAFEGYNTVALLYLVMTLFLSLLVRVIEKRTALPK